MNIKIKVAVVLALAAFVLPGISLAAVVPTTAQLQAEITSLSAQLQVLQAQLVAQQTTVTTPPTPPIHVCPAWGCNGPEPIIPPIYSTSTSPAITVVWPNGGEVLNDNGSSTLGTIKWTSANLGNLNVEIDLVDATTNSILKYVATNIPNTGSYVWASDPTIPNGNYKIMISAETREGASSESNGFFQIIGSPLGTAANPSLIIETPVAGDGYQVGEPMNVSWKESGVTPKNVQISLQNGTSGALATLASIGASTTSMWNGIVPSSTPAGSNYMVIVCDEGIPSPTASGKPLCGHVSPISMAPQLVIVSNPALASGKVAAGTAAAKIGSYIISAPNTEALQLKTVSITEGTNAADFQNFRVLVNGVQFGTTYASSAIFQSFSGNVVLPANGSATVDVLADVLSNTPAGTQNTTEIYAYGVGQTSGAPYTSSGESIVGQTMTVVSMQTATPSITVLSPNKGDLWQLGHTETVKWSSVGMNNISLYVHFSDGGMCFIATRPAAAGTYSFALLPTCSNISSLITPGQYTISLWGDNASTSLNSVHVDSAPFSIVAPSSSFAGGVLTAALSASTPQASYLGMGATGVNVAQYQFTADANSNENLTQLNITDRPSVSAATASTDHATFINYRLTDASGNVLATGVEGANGTIQFNLSSLIIPANSTALVNLVADVNSYPYATSGATHAFALASFNYANPVAANTQIVTSNNVGNLFTVYQTTLGVIGASFTNPTSVSTVGNTVGAFTFTAGNGNINPTVKTITLSTAGSVIQADTTQTLGLYDGGAPTVLLASTTVTGTNSATFNLSSLNANQWAIGTDSSKTLLVKVFSAPANLAALQNGMGSYQVLLRGVTWTDGVTASIPSLSPSIAMPVASQNITGLSNGATTPSTLSLSVTQNSAWPSGSVVAGTQSVKIGSYVFSSPATEGVSLSSILLGVSSDGGHLQNLRILINGAQFSATQAAISVGGTYTFTANPILIPVGASMIVDVYADVLSNNTAGTQITTSINSCAATGQTSYSAYQCPSSPVQGQTMTITTSALALGVAIDSTTPPAGNVVMGSAGNTLAAFRLTATSRTENIKVTSITVSDDTVGPLNVPKSSFSNATLWNGSMLVGSAIPVQAPFSSTSGDTIYAYAFNLASPVVVPAGNAVVLTLKGDVDGYASGGATDGSSHQFFVGSPSAVVAFGATSNAAATVTVASGKGNPQTVYRNTLSATAGTFTNPTSISGVGTTVGSFIFTAGSGNVDALVKTITLSPRGSVMQYNTVQSLGLYDANNPGVALATATAIGDANVTFNLQLGNSNNWGVPANTSRTLLIKMLAAPAPLPVLLPINLPANYEINLAGVTWTDGVTANITTLSSLGPNNVMPIAGQLITPLSTTVTTTSITIHLSDTGQYSTDNSSAFITTSIAAGSQNNLAVSWGLQISCPSGVTLVISSSKTTSATTNICGTTQTYYTSNMYNVNQGYEMLGAGATNTNSSNSYVAYTLTAYDANGNVLGSSQDKVTLSAPAVKVTPTITVLSPNGGEVWHVGETHAITWSTSNLPANTTVGLQLSYQLTNGATYEDVIASYLSGAGSYQWTIPSKYGTGMNSNAFKMRAILYGPNIAGTNAPDDYSNAPFTIMTVGTITASNITVSSPSAGAVFSSPTTPIPVSWTWSEGGVPSAPVMNLIDQNANVVYEAYGAAGGFSYSAQGGSGMIPAPVNLVIPVGTAQYRVQVCTSSARTNCGVGGYFTITKTTSSTINPSISVSIVAPKGGEVLQAGTQYTITWTTAGIPSNATQYIEIMNGTSGTIRDPNTDIVANLPLTATSYTWTVTPNNGWGVGIKTIEQKIADLFGFGTAFASGNQYVIGVGVSVPGVAGNVAWGASAPFTITNVSTPTPAITVLSPNGGEKLIAGQGNVITWTSSGVKTVDISVCGIGGSGTTETCFPLNSAANNVNASLGSFTWNIDPNGQIPGYPGVTELGSTPKIRVTDTASGVYDESNNTFVIAPPGLVLSLDPQSPSGSQAAGKQNTEFMRLDLKNTYSQSITVNELDFAYTTANYNNLSDIKLVDMGTGAILQTLTSNLPQSSWWDAFQVPITIAPGTTKILSLSADMANTNFTLSPKAEVLVAVFVAGEPMVSGNSLTFTSPPVACSLVVPYCPYGSHPVVEPNGCTITVCNSAPTTPSPASTLSASPTSLNFTVSRSNINSPSPASSQLTIANIPSNATVAMSYVNPLPDQGWGAHGWLTISTSSPVSGTTGSATETVTVSTQPWNAPDHGFEAGTYTASITISGNSQTITVPVTLVVSAAPASTAIISQSLTGLFNQLGTFLKSL